MATCILDFTCFVRIPRSNSPDRVDWNSQQDHRVLLAFCYKLSTAARYDPAMFCRWGHCPVFRRQIDAAGRFPVEKPAGVDYARAVIPCSLEFDWRASTKDG